MEQKLYGTVCVCVRVCVCVSVRKSTQCQEKHCVCTASVVYPLHLVFTTHSSPWVVLACWDRVFESALVLNRCFINIDAP